MFYILRNLARRKLRTFLTISGIAVGVFAFTVMGSLSEYVNQMVRAQIELAEGVITVESQYTQGSPGSAPLPPRTKEKLGSFSGVNRVYPFVVTALGGSSMFNLVGMPPKEIQERLLKKLELSEGRPFDLDETDGLIVGYAVARKYKLSPGGKIKFRGHRFEVTGILKPYNDLLYNNSAIGSYETVKKVGNFGPDYARLYIVPEKQNELENLAKKIKREIKGVRVVTPKVAKEQAQIATLVFAAIVLSGAILALVVGGLFIINTLLTAISERTREVGIKKSLGARSSELVREYVFEAAIMSLIGGIVGLLLGYLASTGLNAFMKSEYGLEISKVTSRLSVVALFFSISLGALAGFFPALRAARLDPIQALEEE